MRLLELVTEMETDVAVANAVSPLRLLTIGKYLDIRSGKTVIDFGCGRGEMLCLWARHFGVTGIGVDIDPDLLAHAARRAERWGIADKVEFVCQDVQEFDVGTVRFDVAACMAATMGFGGYRSTLNHLKITIGAGGSLAVAEPFYASQQIPEELRAYEGDFHTEPELFATARSEGLEVGYYARATRDEWDRYIFGSRKTEMQAFLALPPSPAREKRRSDLHRWQDMYLRYRQQWQGMAFLTLHPA